MKKFLFISSLVVLIGGFFASSLIADDKSHHDILAKFKGGIGVHPVSNVTVMALFLSLDVYNFTRSALIASFSLAHPRLQLHRAV
jgi:hypothetical protein